jgi:CheY-like chemotaxis protein
MIVDDDRTTVRLLKTLLELDGYEVAISSKGSEVVALAEEVQPDLFLMDYHLDDIDGIQVINLVRAHPTFKQTPIIMTSGMNMEREALEAGASHFLMKPFNVDHLQSLFVQLIGA